MTSPYTLVFDLDGTLVDTAPDLITALNFVLDREGLPPVPMASLRRIKWHDLRHSYASILASGGMPLFLIRGLLGHSSVKMTERYAHLAASQTASYMPLLSAAAPSTATPAAPPVGPRRAPAPSTRLTRQPLYEIS